MWVILLVTWMVPTGIVREEVKYSFTDKIFGKEGVTDLVGIPFTDKKVFGEEGVMDYEIHKVVFDLLP